VLFFSDDARWRAAVGCRPDAADAECDLLARAKSLVDSYFEDCVKLDLV